MFLRVMEFVIGGFACIIIVTQVMIPLVLNRKTFPIFRKRAVLEKELQQANQDLDDARLTQAVKEVRGKADAVASPDTPSANT